MLLNLKVGDTNEAQQTKTIENTEAYKAGKVEKRPMDYVEKALLQNQKAIAQTISDMENRYTKSLGEFINFNATLNNRVHAMEMQMQSMQVRLAQLQGHGATAK